MFSYIRDGRGSFFYGAGQHIVTVHRKCLVSRDDTRHFWSRPEDEKDGDAGDEPHGVSLAKGPRAISLRLQQLWPMARWLRWEADPPVKLC